MEKDDKKVYEVYVIRKPSAAPAALAIEIKKPLRKNARSIFLPPCRHAPVVTVYAIVLVDKSLLLCVYK